VAVAIARTVSVAGRLVDHESGNPHRVNADHDRGFHLDRELDADLVTLPDPGASSPRARQTGDAVVPLRETTLIASG